MGYAVAAAAKARGHDVVLITGPTACRPPRGIKTVRVTTAAEMLTAVLGHVRHCDALVMAAAVSDWRPLCAARKKLKKHATAPTLRLQRTPDILARVARIGGRRIVVGFAAETGNPVPEARRKLSAKKMDLIVANDVSRADSGFEVDTNRVTFIEAGGAMRELPLMTKKRVAAHILSWIEHAIPA